MKKELSEMTLEELWKLFPIFLVEHDDKRSVYYEEIELLLQKALYQYPVDRIWIATSVYVGVPDLW